MRYLSFFARATSLCKQCKLSLSECARLRLQYDLRHEVDGYLRFTLDPASAPSGSRLS